MKKLFLLSVLVAVSAFAEDHPFTRLFGTNNVIATATTNTTDGSIIEFPQAPGVARIWQRTQGGPGATATDGVVGIYSLGFAATSSSSTNTVRVTNFVHWTESDIRITTTPLGNTNVWASDWFECGGGGYIRQTATINISGGTTTNEAWITWHARPK